MSIESIAGCPVHNEICSPSPLNKSETHHDLDFVGLGLRTLCVVAGDVRAICVVLGHGKLPHGCETIGHRPLHVLGLPDDPPRSQHRLMLFQTTFQELAGDEAASASVLAENSAGVIVHRRVYIRATAPWVGGDTRIRATMARRPLCVPKNKKRILDF